MSIGQSTPVWCESLVTGMLSIKPTYTAPQDYDLPSRSILAAAFGFGFVVESPVAVALVGTVGVCSLAYQLAVAITDMHVISDVWMYSDLKAISRLLAVWKPSEPPQVLSANQDFFRRN